MPCQGDGPSGRGGQVVEKRSPTTSRSGFRSGWLRSIQLARCLVPRPLWVGTRGRSKATSNRTKPWNQIGAGKKACQGEGLNIKAKARPGRPGLGWRDRLAGSLRIETQGVGGAPSTAGRGFPLPYLRSKLNTKSSLSSPGGRLRRTRGLLPVIALPDGGYTPRLRPKFRIAALGKRSTTFPLGVKRLRAA